MEPHSYGMGALINCSGVASGKYKWRDRGLAVRNATRGYCQEARGAAGPPPPPFFTTHPAATFSIADR
jgi:hypothetical protein